MSTQEALSTAGALQHQIETLKDTLVIPNATFPTQEREAFRAASVDLRDAESEFHELSRKHANQTGHIHPDVERAAANVERSRKALALAGSALEKAKLRRADRFHRDIAASVERAAPTLKDVCSLVEDAIEPLLQLHRHALLHGLGTSPLLDTARKFNEAQLAMSNALTAQRN